MNYNKNHYYIEGVSSKIIASKFNTPIYCYSYKKLKYNIINFKKKFNSFKPIICFSVKSNTNVNLLKEIKKFGFGADVVSMGEMMKARKAGISPKKIVFSGVGKTSKEINNSNLSYNKVDVSNFEQVNSAVLKITSSSNIDILINNAGITGSNSTVWEYNVNEWNKIVQINLMGTFYCCKSVVPHMIEKNYGKIVNIASIAGKEGNPNAMPYSAAKAGVIALTKSLGKELADKNIAVNCVTPAAAKTRIFDQISQEHIDYMLSKIPRNRFVKVEELASLVAWMSSDENSYTTAGVFDLSGGRATY